MTRPRILILSATWPEIWKTSRRLELNRHNGWSDGCFAGCDVMILVTGMGADRMRLFMLEELTRHPTDWILCAGFAGGLNPNLKVGSLLMPGCLIKAGEDVITMSDGQPDQSLLTIEHVVNRVEDKHALFQNTHADAIDMESYAIVDEARALGVDCSVVRTISDDAHSALPEVAAGWMQDDGLPKVREPLMWALGGWSRFKMLLKLQKDTNLAAIKLSETIPAMIRTWAETRRTERKSP